MDKKKKTIVMSLLTSIIGLSGAIGGTYAIFSAVKTSTTNIKMAKVDLETSFKEDTLKTYSMGVLQESGAFENGGSASFVDLDVDGNVVRGLSLERISPGDSVKFSAALKNKSNIAIQYRVQIALADESDCPLLLSGAKDWARIVAGGEIEDQEFEISFPKESGNEYQEKSFEVLLNFEAVQANAIS